MKKHFAILLLLLAGLGVSAQEVNKFDANGKRHGQWKGTYDTTKRKRYDGNFEHGVETGTFKFYENDNKSTLMATRDFSAGDGSSYTIFYDDKGNKLSEGREVNRLREGEWKFYHPGKKSLMSVEKYTAGKLTGLKQVYFPNGTLGEQAEYKNGQLNGKYMKYTEAGILIEESTYKDGKMNGAATFYNGSGEVDSKGQYKDNIRTGIWKFYKNGKLTKEEDLTNKKVELKRQRD